MLAYNLHVPVGYPHVRLGDHMAILKIVYAFVCTVKHCGKYCLLGKYLVMSKHQLTVDIKEYK